MAKAIWQVQSVTDYGKTLIGTFSSRRKMIEAVEQKFEVDEIYYNADGKPSGARAREKGWVFDLRFTRQRIDTWRY